MPRRARSAGAKPIGSEVLAAPAIGAGVVAVRTVDGRLRGFSLANGSTIWTVEQNLPSITLRGNTAPRVAGTLVVSGFNNGRVGAYEIADGEAGVGSRHREPDRPQRARAVGRRERRPADRRQRRLRRRLSRPRRRHRPRDRRRALAARLVVVRGPRRRHQQRLRDERLRRRHRARAAQAGTQLWRQEALRLRDVTAPTRYANTLVVGDFEGYLHWLSPDDGSSSRASARPGSESPPRRSSSGRTSTCKATTAPWPRTPCANDEEA